MYKKNHPNKIIMDHININSFRNKFDMLTNSVTEVILIISKTKVEYTLKHVFYHLKDFPNLYS